MAVVFDAIGGGDEDNLWLLQGTTFSASWTHTCTGTDLAVVVGLVISDDGTDLEDMVRSVTYDGVPMPSLGAVAYKDGTCVEMFGMIAPPTGPKTVAVTGSGYTFADGSLAANSVSYTGVLGFDDATIVSGPGTPKMSFTVPSKTAYRVPVVMGAQAALSGFSQTTRYGKNYYRAHLLLGDAGGLNEPILMSASHGSKPWGAVAVPLLAANVSSSMAASVGFDTTLAFGRRSSIPSVPHRVTLRVPKER